MTAMLWVFAAGFLPLGVALRANRTASLWSALWWSAAAWSTWLAYAASAEQAEESAALRYFALCLTGCASVAVLGARRPHAGPWNYVVLSLLAVMLLPFFEALVLGSETFDLLRTILLGGTILLGVVNYLPTRCGAAAAAIALACGGQLAIFRGWIAADDRANVAAISLACVAATPWLAWLGLRARPRPSVAVDELWLDFRDRFGSFWGLRVREQFNRAAGNAGWPVHLTWSGLQGTCAAATESAALAALRALTQRFL